MSQRRFGFDTRRFDAIVFRADSVRFEACPTFHGGLDPEVCNCGWLEVDHVAVVSRRRFPRRRRQPTTVRRAS